MLDNCPSHKTDLVRKMIRKLRIPTIYSAPASFLAIPVEGVFGAIKQKNFLNEPDPDIQTLRELEVRKLTNKQRLIYKISNYLFDLERDKVQNIFFKRLQRLEHFLLRKPI